MDKVRLEKTIDTINLDLFPTSTIPPIKPSILPADTLEQEPYIAILNGTATNQLINSTTQKPVVDTITGNATIEKGTLKVFIAAYGELPSGLRVSTCKLLDACTIELTKQNNYRGNEADIKPQVIIPLDRYMELCGIPATKASKDKTRRKVNEDLEILFHISMEWTEQSGGKQRDFAKMRICDTVGIVNGNIMFSFSLDMAKYLINAYIMLYSKELLKLDERNANIYPMGRKLLLHNSIDNNQRKGTANIISVKALLAVCSTIPSYDNVMNTDRHLDQRIKTPFENALNALPFIQWEYSNSKGVPLTDEQIAIADYKTFIELYILFKVIDAPDQTARLQARAEEAKALAERKMRTATKKKSGTTAV